MTSPNMNGTAPRMTAKVSSPAELVFVDCFLLPPNSYIVAYARLQIDHAQLYVKTDDPRLPPQVREHLLQIAKVGPGQEAPLPEGFSIRALRFIPGNGSVIPIELHITAISAVGLRDEPATAVQGSDG